MSEPDPSPDAAFEAGCDHPHEAVGPPDAMDAAMSAMLDLQDDLAGVVMWLAENWSTDLPSPYLHGARPLTTSPRTATGRGCGC